MLIDVSKQDSYLVSQKEWRTESFGDAAVSYTLDLSSQHCQIETDRDDCTEIAITSPQRLQRFVRKPSTLDNASSTLLRTTDVVLLAFTWKLTLMFFSDIRLLSESRKNFKDHMRHQLMLGSSERAFLKFKICQFFAKPIVYSLYINHKRCLETASRNTCNICRYQKPRFIEKIKMLLESSCVFRWFVFRITKITDRLNKWLREKHPMALWNLKKLH